MSGYTNIRVPLNNFAARRFPDVIPDLAEDQENSFRKLLEAVT